MKGKAKKDYQREYMRRRRSNSRGLIPDEWAKVWAKQQSDTPSDTHLSASGKKRPKRREEMSPEELGITGHDADGNALYED